MIKEEKKPTVTKSNIESGSKKTSKTSKEDASSTSSQEQTSTDGNSPKSNKPEKKAYVRGESQKPVTDEYRKNWHSIFKRG